MFVREGNQLIGSGKIHPPHHMRGTREQRHWAGVKREKAVKHDLLGGHELWFAIIITGEARTMCMTL